MDADLDGVGDACDLMTCGDGVLAADPGSGLPLEDCDDGNLVDGDGCSAFCRIEPPPFCDVNVDGRIDRLDIRAIRRARGTPPSGTDDPRDANGDGAINREDVSICRAECDVATCRTNGHGPRCGLIGIEFLGPLGLFHLVRRRRGQSSQTRTSLR
ncbi:MAG: DUF4215 domain-containing protein [bacterium]|nr:DUF4215 domain-containing protein [bacterium]